MNDETQDPRQSDIDNWLEANASADASPEPDMCTADHLFLDSLLERAFQKDEANLESAVQRVMNQIEEPSAETTVVDRRSRRRRWLVAGLQLAAGVSGVGLLWIFATATSSAHAAVARAITESVRPRDRHYSVQTQLGAGRVRQTIQAELYMRGESKFVVRHPAPLGGDVWFGTDGMTGWLVPSVGPVVVLKDPNAMDKLLKDREIEVPFVQIPPILIEMSQRYDLELLPASTDDRGRDLQHIRGKRRAALALAAPQIDLWLERETGLVVRMIHDWRLPDFAPGIHEMRFELVDQETQSDDWFSHSRRHDASRPTLQFDVPQMKDTERGRP